MTTTPGAEHDEAIAEALEGALAHCEKCHWCADHVSIAIRTALAALAAPASAGGGEPVYYGIDGGNMTPPIPQEIVEAAARAAHAERRRLMPTLHIWDDAGDLIKDEYRRVAIAVLEAAAPRVSEGEIEAALRPFATFGMTENGEQDIRDGLMRDRICDWFGPSDFDRARELIVALSRAREAGSAQELATDPTKILSAGTTTSPGTVGKEGPALAGENQRLRELNAQLSAKVSNLTRLLDEQLGTPCEQIRHEQAQSELVEALRPFADEAERIDDAHAKMNVDDEWDALGAVIKMGDLRRARAVIAKLASGGGGNVSR